jgi:Flp pilus assembly pilin Flp
MRQWLCTLWRDEDGQDMIEYSLLITFILIVTVGVLTIGGSSISGIVNTSNSQIAAANRFVGG